MWRFSFGFTFAGRTPSPREGIESVYLWRIAQPTCPPTTRREPSGCNLEAVPPGPECPLSGCTSSPAAGHWYRRLPLAESGRRTLDRPGPRATRHLSKSWKPYLAPPTREVKDEKWCRLVTAASGAGRPLSSIPAVPPRRSRRSRPCRITRPCLERPGRLRSGLSAPALSDESGRCGRSDRRSPSGGSRPRRRRTRPHRSRMSPTRRWRSTRARRSASRARRSPR